MHGGVIKRFVPSFDTQESRALLENLVAQAVYRKQFTARTELAVALTVFNYVFSQSGAFLLNRYSQTPELRPAYLISLGNQTDLSLGDMMRYFRDSDAVDVIAVYVEGFRDLDGLAFASAVREAVCAGKQVIFYKAGRTPEGRSATSGHTASLAGDYMVCESSLRQAGAIVARTFNEFQDLVLLADAFGGMPIRGTRLGAVSGAGFEAVGMADNIQSEEYSMTLGSLSEETRAAMRALIAEKKLDKLVTVANPLDINPGADDETHARMAELVAGGMDKTEAYRQAQPKLIIKEDIQ